MKARRSAGRLATAVMLLIAAGCTPGHHPAATEDRVPPGETRLAVTNTLVPPPVAGDGTGPPSSTTLPPRPAGTPATTASPAATITPAPGPASSASPPSTTTHLTTIVSSLVRVPSSTAPPGPATTIATPAPSGGGTSTVIEYVPEPVKGDGLCSQDKFRTLALDFAQAFDTGDIARIDTQLMAKAGWNHFWAPERSYFAAMDRSTLVPYLNDLYQRNIRIDQQNATISGYATAADAYSGGGQLNYGGGHYLSMNMQCRTLTLLSADWFF